MISVAMCTYNGAEHIREQLESITEQSVQPDEIVICDDGSSDDTVKIVKDVLDDWLGKYKVIENEINLGFSKNFRKAVELCEGDIIFLSDQDDVWHKEKIAIMYDMMNRHPNALLVVHDSVLVDMNRQVLYDSFWRYLSPDFNPDEFDSHDYNRLFMSNVIQGCACAFRKVLFQKALPFPEAACHDEWLALVAVAKDGLFLIKQPLLEYRQGNNQIGALRPSIMDRVCKWSRNFHKASVKWFCERERRDAVLTAFQERYNTKLSEINVNSLQKWVEFNRFRLKVVKSFSPQLLISVKNYFSMFSPNWAIKLWIKDILIMFLGESIQNNKERAA